MKYCNNCGAQMQDTERFCPQCGADNSAAQQPYQQAQQPQYQAQQPYQQAQQPQYQAQQPYQQNQAQPNAFQKFMNTTDTTAAFHPDDIKQNKFMAVLSYIGILALIPFFGSKQSPYAQYHAKQGMNLLMLDLAVGIVNILLGLIKVSDTYLWVTYYRTPGWVSAIRSILSLIMLAFAVCGIVYAAQGKAKEIPVVNKIKIFK